MITQPTSEGHFHQVNMGRFIPKKKKATKTDVLNITQGYREKTLQWVPHTDVGG